MGRLQRELSTGRGGGRWEVGGGKCPFDYAKDLVQGTTAALTAIVPPALRPSGNEVDQARRATCDSDLERGGDTGGTPPSQWEYHSSTRTGLRALRSAVPWETTRCETFSLQGAAC